MDPNLSVAASEQLRKWYRARDTFLGWNFCVQNMAEGLRLAGECEHVDARWLCDLFWGRGPLSKEEAKAIFLAAGEDGRALCFAGRVSTYDERLFRRSAELGYAQAQVMLSIWAQDPRDKLVWVERAFAQRERTAIALMAEYLWHGTVCPKDQRRSLQLFREAAKMDHVLSQHFLGGRGYGEHNAKRYKWWGVAAANGNGASRDLLANCAVEQVALLGQGAGPAHILVAVGAACRGHVDAETCSVFGVELSGREFSAVCTAVQLAEESCAKAREVILLWMWYARGRGMRDPGRIIAKMVWAERSAWCEQ